MIIVTGGAGMIGSNIIHTLNKRGHKDIIVVDNLKNGKKFINLINLDILDYIDKNNFLTDIKSNKHFKKSKVIFHQGACSNTTEWNGHYMMENNYQYSKILLKFCIQHEIPLIYASSASVYGHCQNNCMEERLHESPLNIYAYSKMLFDHYVRKILHRTNIPICGLRYFNIYGKGEKHKKNMSSVILHFYNQIKQGESLKLFKDSDKFKRDFTYVDDIVDINLWCWENMISGIYNCGTGHAESFQTIANIIIQFYAKGNIEYIDLPEEMKYHYQKFTQANLTKLHQVGYQKSFERIYTGIIKYLKWLQKYDI